MQLFLVLYENKPEYIGRSLSTSERVTWYLVLLMENIIKIMCIISANLISAQSTTVVELLGNTFGVFIVAELASISCSYIYASVEVNINEVS